MTNQNAPHVPTSVGVLVSSLSTDPTKTVQTSNKLLLVLASDALNTGMAFTDYKRTHLFNNYYGSSYDGSGQLPILLRRAAATIRIRNVNAGTLKVYPLNQDGPRRTQMTNVTTAVEGADTWLVIPIDTGSNTGGPAVFFELSTT